MTTKKHPHEEDQQSVPIYNSNPFTLAFDAVGRLFKYNSGWAITLIALSALSTMVQLIDSIASSSSSSTTSSSSTVSSAPPEAATIIAIVIVVLVFLLVFIAIVSVVGTYIQGMLSYVALKSEEEKSVSFSEAFQATTARFWRLFGAQLLAGLKVFGWTLLFIVPGIIAALRYKLLPYVIMSEPETEKGIGESHATTKTLVKGRLLEVFGIATASSIIPIVGSLVGMGGNAALYKQLAVYNQKGLEKPKIHWLNYLGIMLLGLLFAFIIFILFIVLLVALASSSN